MYTIKIIFNTDCSTGDIRLSAGRNGSEGRVEICIGGSWGTVCDDFWGTVDAQVVCNQLGFARTGISCNITVQTIPHYIISLVGAVAVTTFAAGSGSIFLDNVQCSGSESRLIDCSHSGIGTHNCVHSEDAGVRCQIREFSYN